ncbi:hypothetical protein [Marinobacter litoralis]|uniref:hypothetical protein n=1 Tax=Marinobacter litoralis TaxID=187981 RepID=UPI0018EB4F0D|nr:hypothetical protein [Marinobacter litoralis]MBJ6136053.1 hypothetical protein [Marinobacter litoralis]
MNIHTSNVPSIAEINQAIELAKKERSEYMAEKTSALTAKINTTLRSVFHAAAGKLTPSH